MVSKIVLPALALVGSAFAQQCGNGGDFTIRSAVDATQLSGCREYDGNIIIDSGVTGAVALNGVSAISGDLRIVGPSTLTSLSADLLQFIRGEWYLDGLTALTTVQFDSLRAVNRLNWTALPLLQSLQFRTGVSLATTVDISNTGLRDIAGIELTTVSSLVLANNGDLSTVNVNELTNVTTALSLSGNNPGLSLTLPNLQSAANISIRDVAAVSMPSLARVTGSMGFYMTTFTNFTATNLTSIRETMAFVNCSDLTDLEFPSLTIIGGGLLLADDPQLKEITGFPLLSRVGGAIDISGDITAVSMPALFEVRGSTNVQSSSGNATICDTFNTTMHSNVFRGKVFCDPSSTNPTNNQSGQVDDTKRGTASALTNSAAIMTAAVGFAVAMFFL